MVLHLGLISLTSLCAIDGEDDHDGYAGDEDRRQSTLPTDRPRRTLLLLLVRYSENFLRVPHADEPVCVLHQFHQPLVLLLLLLPCCRAGA
uniref:Putative secreted protein n=1 Tax=Anopheles darlingi TaxID=43151 RepID=A0A2M4D0W3_ANODA